MHSVTGYILGSYFDWL